MRSHRTQCPCAGCVPRRYYRPSAAHARVRSFVCVYRMCKRAHETYDAIRRLVSFSRDVATLSFSPKLEFLIELYIEGTGVCR